MPGQRQSQREQGHGESADSGIKRRLTDRLLSPTVLAVLLVVLGILLWQRDWWWSPFFQWQAEQALRSGELEAAHEWLDYAEWLVEDDPATDLLRTRAYRKQGDMPAAREALNAAQTNGAPLADVQREHALALAQTGQLAEAEPLLPDLLIDPDADIADVCEAFTLGYIRHQRLDDAFRLLNTWIADEPREPRALRLRGKLLLHHEKYREAERDLRTVTELDPSDLEAKLDLAEALHKQGEADQAAVLFESLLDEPDVATDARIGLARSLISLGRGEQARVHLLQAVDERPDPDALHMLGQLQLNDGENVSAAQTLRKAYEARPYDDGIRYSLALALSRSGQEDAAQQHFAFVEEATAARGRLSQLADELRENPRNVNALLESGKLLLRFGDPHDGVVRLLAALDVDPGNPKALALLADHYELAAAENPKFAPQAKRYRQAADEVQ